MQYKNLDITPGLPAVLSFELLDDNFVKIDPTGYTFKLDILDKNRKIILSKSADNVIGLGNVTFICNSLETAKIEGPVSAYSLVVIASNSFGRLAYTGFLASRPGVFDVNDVGTGSTIILPDGSLYPTGRVTVQYDSWYAIATFFRFLVSGTGTLVIDGRDLRGITFPNMSVFIANTPTAERWIPNLHGMTAFRIKQVSGLTSTEYLP
jgi:hypothetical protein